MKRIMDMIGAVLGLGVLSPVLVILAVLILLADGWPVLFLQERVGQNGRIFRIIKFRTMKEGPASRGVQLTVCGDERVTKIGRALRRSKLDELPQLVNILLGQMSFVGPRPEVQEFVTLYTSAERDVLCLKPGLTDLASLEFFREEDILAQASDPRATYVDQVMPEKIRINLEYARRANVFTDMGVLWATARVIVTGGRSREGVDG